MQVIQIPIETVSNIQLLDALHTSKKQICTELLSTHRYDDTAAVLESPVYIKLQEQVAKSLIDFETAKSMMLKEYTGVKDTNTIKSWSLDYANAQLTYEL